MNGQLFSLSNSGNTRTISDGISQRGFSEVVYRSFSSIPNEIYYWVLPESFRGDKVRGINKKTARLRDKRGNNCFRFLSEISLLFSPLLSRAPTCWLKRRLLPTERTSFEPFHLSAKPNVGEKDIDCFSGFFFLLLLLTGDSLRRRTSLHCTILTLSPVTGD